MSKIIDLVGCVFGRLTVIGRSTNKPRYWSCRCECSKIVEVFGGNLTSGKTRSCGCLGRELSSQRRLEDLTGMTFGRLTVLRRSSRNDNQGRPKWICQCSNDRNIVEVRGEYLRNGITRSCGCLSKELASKRLTTWETSDEKALATIYKAMKQRCYDANSSSYKNYGARGVYMCSEWLQDERSFVDWARSAGYSPYLTIERIDNNGPYAPWNCRWATRTEQANNRRSNRYISANGLTMTIAEWARYLGVDYREIWSFDESEVIRAIEQIMRSH